MKQKIIPQPLGLIDPNLLKADEKFIFSIKYEMFKDQTVRLFQKNSYLVVHTTFWDKLDKKWDVTQEEFPLSALVWIVDRFENGFLKNQDEGGLSDFERSVSKEFEGELIGINIMANCCAENLPGFNVWNSNRISYIDKISPHQWDIPRYMLIDEGVLERLKKLEHDTKDSRS